jgi:hypothetical protein
MDSLDGAFRGCAIGDAGLVPGEVWLKIPWVRPIEKPVISIRTATKNAANQPVLRTSLTNHFQTAHCARPHSIRRSRTGQRPSAREDIRR